MFKNIAELQDYINLFITSTDESILLTLDGLTPEFWLPGTIVPFISSIENELKKELDDVRTLQYELILNALNLALIRIPFRRYSARK